MAAGLHGDAGTRRKLGEPVRLRRVLNTLKLGDQAVAGAARFLVAFAMPFEVAGAGVEPEGERADPADDEVVLLGLTEPDSGSPSALPLTGEGSALPTLVADPAAGRSLTAMASETLRQVDTILGDNADAIKSTMDSLKSFAGALARNSGKVDGVMAGLERMTGGGPAKVLSAIYDLATPTLSGLPANRPKGQLVIVNPTAVVAMQTQRLLTRSQDGQLAPTGEMQWSDALPSLVQAKILQSFDDTGLAATLAAPTTFGKDDRQLQIDLRAFNVTTQPDRMADVAFSVKMLSIDGQILSTRLFQAKVPCSSTDDVASVKALDTAIGLTINDLARWI